MSDATRQANRRKRLKQDGMVDIRCEVSKTTRDKLKKLATTKNTTMKDIIRGQLEKVEA